MGGISDRSRWADATGAPACCPVSSVLDWAPEGLSLPNLRDR